jgi:hypothetical protein
MEKNNRFKQLKNYILLKWRLIVLATMCLVTMITGGAALYNGSKNYWNGTGGHGIAEAIICAACLGFTFNWYKLHKGKDW